MSLKDVQPLPLVLFPVYRFFCAASLTGLRSLGCLIHASRVGQRPPLFYHKQLFVSAKSQRILAAGRVSRPVTFSRSCQAVLEGRGFYPISR
jgi:hypothetical protein